MSPAFAPAAGHRHGPLSADQERMWLFDRLLPGSVSYDAPTAVRLRGSLCLPALSAAIHSIGNRHDSLRTTFPLVDGVPVQHVENAAGCRVAVVYADLGGVHEHGIRFDALAALLEAEPARAFDLERGPLWRVAVIRLSADDHVLVIGMHHLIADLWSVGIVLAELSAAYQARVDGQPEPSSGAPSQPLDLAASQRDRPTPRRLESSRMWWRGRLANVEPVELPTDHPRPALPNLSANATEGHLPAELSGRLRHACAATGATLYMGLLAAFNAFVVRWSGCTDIVTVSVGAGRRGRAAERAVGMFTECLVIRVDAGGDPSFAELLTRVRGAVLDAIDHIDLPFAELVAQVDPGRDLEPSPLRQLGFSLHNTPPIAPILPGLALADLPGASVEPGLTISEADLWLEVFDRGGGPLAYRLQLDNRLFDPGTLDPVIRAFTEILDTVTRDPVRRVSELGLAGLASVGPGQREDVHGRPAGPAHPDTVSAVAALVAELLGVNDVQGRDNFFRLGGASMDAVRLGARLAEALGAEVSLYELMTAGTVEGVAGAVERRRR